MFVCTGISSRLAPERKQLTVSRGLYVSAKRPIFGLLSTPTTAPRERARSYDSAGSRLAAPAPRVRRRGSGEVGRRHNLRSPGHPGQGQHHHQRHHARRRHQGRGSPAQSTFLRVRWGGGKGERLRPWTGMGRYRTILAAPGASTELTIFAVAWELRAVASFTEHRGAPGSGKSPGRCPGSPVRPPPPTLLRRRRRCSNPLPCRRCPGEDDPGVAEGALVGSDLVGDPGLFGQRLRQAVLEGGVRHNARASRPRARGWCTKDRLSSSARA